jgi:hypothetical protein
MFALWTWTGDATGRAPEGDRESIPLAVPTGERGAIEVAAIDCALVDPDDLLGLVIDDAGPSVDAWRAALREASDLPDPSTPRDAPRQSSAPQLPVAAHAVPDASGASIFSAERALRVLRETRSVAAELRTTLKADLRPYQARGVGWLHETVAAHGGAMLADEMGLGKTVQTIGFLLGRAATGPQLVICPTSLVGNWAHEITRFAPSLRPVVWRGGDLATGAGAVVITGYPTLRLHGHALLDQTWATAVFDEAQALKNPRTQIAKAARALIVDARVALTGTPVENHLEELFALLNLVRRDCSGTAPSFGDGSSGRSTRVRPPPRPGCAMRSNRWCWRARSLRSPRRCPRRSTAICCVTSPRNRKSSTTNCSIGPSTTASAMAHNGRAGCSRH